ncbi:MAG: hypothetical protein M3362_23015 [Acidobacteriota bacterium]|nr:hypothetical protein [Acidobacteriota bacterium]
MSRPFERSSLILSVILLVVSLVSARGQTITSSKSPSSSVQTQTQQTAPAVSEWFDDFNGTQLDEAKWERFTFEGGGGGKVEVKDGELRLRGANGTRAGVRSKQAFEGDRFIVEAHVAKVAPQLPTAGDKAGDLGFAALTILFDSSGRNRIEWILTSEGTLEAWSVVDGAGERLDNRKLGTKLKNPVLAVVRRGDEFLFVLNGPDSPAKDAQVGLTKVIKNMPRSFHVMLYGFGSSENNWDSARVVTAKQP